MGCQKLNAISVLDYAAWEMAIRELFGLIPFGIHTIRIERLDETASLLRKKVKM